LQVKNADDINSKRLELYVHLSMYNARLNDAQAEERQETTTCIALHNTDHAIRK